MVDRELLRNDHPRVDLLGRYPCNILSAQAIPTPSVPEKYLAHINFDFLRHFCLSSDGRLTFLRYTFPDYEELPPQEINLTFEGNFSVQFEHLPGGPKITVPFVDGVIVEDSAQWDIEERPLDAIVTRPVPGGLLLKVFTGRSEFLAFLPRSFVPEHLRNDLESQVDTKIQCDIYFWDTKRRTAVVRPLGWS